MADTLGIDLLRGRPATPLNSTQAKLQQRKLDALRRGIHRIGDTCNLAYGVHVLGVGDAGAELIGHVLQDAPGDLLSVPGSRFSGLAITLDPPAAWPARPDLASMQLETLVLGRPDTEALLASQADYRRWLELEYPLLQGCAPLPAWLDAELLAEASDTACPRALAKAVYGQAYYAGERPLLAALRRFAASVEQGEGDALVCLAFDLADDSASGMALDVARHLSNGLFGRRVLVLGMGLLPDGEPSPSLFPLLNELACLCDDQLNRGVVQACGDLYKNPFTAGFLLAGAGSGKGPATPTLKRQELAGLISQRRGANLWELLRLLNWVAAPATQHSAARSPWGERWVQLLGFGEAAQVPVAGLAMRLGVMPGYRPEFIELRVPNDLAGESSAAWVAALDAAFAPESPAQPATGGAAGRVQFVLPRLAREDLAVFFAARQAYDRVPATTRRLAHSLLLERGVVLSEPSTVIDGMAGASWAGGSAWVAVPLAALRGPHPSLPHTREISHAS